MWTRLGIAETIPDQHADRWIRRIMWALAVLAGLPSYHAQDERGWDWLRYALSSAALTSSAMLLYWLDYLATLHKINVAGTGYGLPSHLLPETTPLLPGRFREAAWGVPFPSRARSSLYHPTCVLCVQS